VSDLWKVRHEGSPEHVEMPLILLQQGLLDGEWELTDEVQGPGETQWRVIEDHPEFEELALDIEEPPPASHEEEGHLDMTPLIDVCMVLLIFFILITTVAALQKQIEAPTTAEGKPGIPVLTKEKVEQQMVLVRASVVNGETVIKVEDQEVPLDQLLSKLKGVVKGEKTDLLLDHDNQVTQEVVVQIIDEAKKAGVRKINMVVK
jgi:biopolymer transport protein ExbD